MPANPFQIDNPIPDPVGPLSGEAHYDIDQVTTVVTQNINPDGTMPDGSSRDGGASRLGRKAQAGAPAFQTGKPFKQGRC